MAVASFRPAAWTAILIFDMVQIPVASQADPPPRSAVGGDPAGTPVWDAYEPDDFWMQRSPSLMRISAIGRGSISSFLKVAVDIAWVLACAALGFIWIVTAVAVFSILTGGNIAMFEHIDVSQPGGIVRWTLQWSIACIGAMIVCAYLRGVFETLINGDPFVPDNARRLRAIAIVLAVLELVRMTISIIVQILLGVFGVAATDAAGEAATQIGVQLNLSVWFSVLTLVVLAQVFSEGAALREEQKMTI
jgi:hypothetical protein